MEGGREGGREEGREEGRGRERERIETQKHQGLATWRLLDSGFCRGQSTTSGARGRENGVDALGARHPRGDGTAAQGLFGNGFRGNGVQSINANG